MPKGMILSLFYLRLVDFFPSFKLLLGQNIHKASRYRKSVRKETCFTVGRRSATEERKVPK